MDLVVAFLRMVTALVPWTAHGRYGLLVQDEAGIAVATDVGAAVAAEADARGRASAPSSAAAIAIRVERMGN
ncbi:hypothetical protein SGFS_020610 [Streptomyces graminofaciens]|uniref:Uncharacterized protein n=1 Tax=Streptomyces graminofaciens TaxID=68212 RepID=A0ABM7F2B7_9ACTN|nr:hypothetical protein SGFS_020610 [Streptomyces graminofaciens]